METGRFKKRKACRMFRTTLLVWWHSEINWHSDTDFQASFIEEVFKIFNWHRQGRRLTGSRDSSSCGLSSFEPLQCRTTLMSSEMLFSHSEPYSVSDNGLLPSAILMSWFLRDFSSHTLCKMLAGFFTCYREYQHDFAATCSPLSTLNALYPFPLYQLPSLHCQHFMMKKIQ